jgi:hypothetical protein
MPLSRHAVEIGVLAGVGDLIIYQHFVPPISDVRMQAPMNKNIEGSERTALYAGIVWTVLVTAFTQKIETFAIAGGVLAVLDFAYKHAIAVNPASGKMADSSQGAYSLPDYETDGTG